MKKQIYLIPIIAMGATSLLACGGAKTKTYSVSLALTEALSLSKEQAKQGKTFDADITLKDLYKPLCEVPNTLIEVKSGDKVLRTDVEEYFYTVQTSESGNVGHISIPGKFVQGDIVIKASASPDEVEVTATSEQLLFSYSQPHVGDTVEVDVSVQDTAASYVLPDKLLAESVIVTPKSDSINADGYKIGEICAYSTNADKTRGRIKIPSTYKKEDETYLVVQGAIAINLNGVLATYKVTASSDSLTFSGGANVNLPEATKGNDYSFKVTPKESTKKRVPNSLNITIGDNPLGRISYKIEGSGVEKTVTISGAHINGDINIAGEAVESDKIIANFVGESVNASVSGVVAKGKKFTTELTAFKGHKLPEKQNVGVGTYNTDEGDYDWHSPEDTGKITYRKDGNKVVITVDEEYTDNDIVIVAKANDVSILARLDWETISSYSKNGYSPYLFDYGEETKAFEIKGLSGKYKARVIDFKRDIYQGTSRTLVAGTTFEFTECITESQFSSAENPNNSTYYASEGATAYESELYKNLNGFSTGLYNKLPFSKYLVEVKKDSLKGTEGEITHTGRTGIATSYNYMFPLSLFEMGYPNLRFDYKVEKPSLGGDKPYHYYDNDKGIEKLIKKYQGSESIYWSRTSSEYEIALNKVNAILKDGSYHFMDTTGTSRGVAPAFCI